MTSIMPQGYPPAQHSILPPAPSRVASLRFGRVSENDNFQKAAPTAVKKPQYGKFQNNLREFVRIALVNLLPLMLAPISFAGWAGFLLSLVFMPLLYIAGNIGRSVGKHVDPHTLAGPLKLFHRLHDVLNPSLTPQEKEKLQERLRSAQTPEARRLILKQFQSRDHVDKINSVLSDFVATLKLPKSFSAFVQNEQLRLWILNTLKVDSKTKLGRVLNAFINNRTLFQNQVFSNISNSETMGAAFKSGAKGAWTGFIDFTLMPKVGQVIMQATASPICPNGLKPVLRAFGEMCKNWFVTKSFVDFASIRRFSQ